MIDVRNPHPGHVLRALAQLSAECGCGAGWHFIDSNQTPAEAGGEITNG